MSRYLAYSSVLHGLVLGSLFFFLSWSPRPQAYYGFQFLGGQSGFGTGRLEPAPAPTPTRPEGTVSPAANPVEETLPKSEDLDRVAIEKKSDTTKKSTPAPKTPEKNQAKKGGTKGGRGNSPLGHGDFQGSKTGPVGGVGTSLEIGGFGPGGGGGADKQFPFKWYGELVYKRLWEAWDRTDAGTRECKISFKILKDGKVTGLKVKNSSGDFLFDNTAKRAVTSAAPFPPLPEGFKESDLPILVRFRLQ
jgi:protein TonB